MWNGPGSATHRSALYHVREPQFRSALGFEGVPEKGFRHLSGTVVDRAAVDTGRIAAEQGFEFKTAGGGFRQEHVMPDLRLQAFNGEVRILLLKPKRALIEWRFDIVLTGHDAYRDAYLRHAFRIENPYRRGRGKRCYGLDARIAIGAGLTIQ